MSPYLLRIATTAIIVIITICIVRVKQLLLPPDVSASPILIIATFLGLLSLTGILSFRFQKQFHWVGAIALTTIIILIDAAWLITNPPIVAPATPTATPTVSNGYVYVKIATKDIQQRTGALLISQPAQLLIVTDLDATPEPAGRRADRGSVRECVTVSALLNTNGGWGAANVESASDILLMVKSESLQSVVYGLAHADQIWIATDPVCNGQQDGE